MIVSLRRVSPRLLILLAFYAGLLLGGAFFGDKLARALDLDLWPHTEDEVHFTIMVSLAVYVVSMMLPFVPGIEIGLALMAMFGARIVPVVYAATVLALVLAFTAGRLLKPERLGAELAATGLSRAARLVREGADLDPAARRARVESSLPGPLRSWLLRYPALMLLVLFNMPGNALAGGGGGIALVLGASRLVTWPAYVLGVLPAVAPVPLIILLGAALN